MEESNDPEKKILDFAEEMNSTVQVRASYENLDEDRFITEEKIFRDPVSVRFNKPKNSFTKRRRKSEEEDDDADEDKKKAKLCSEDMVLDSDEIIRLRNVSRQEYVKNREKKKVEALRDEIKDEIMVSDGVKLTEKEEIEFRYKKELYELIKQTEDDDDVDEYRIPDAYDQEGCIDQKKRFAVVAQRYSERRSSMRGVTEQEAWEDHQAQKGTVRFGSKDKKKVIDGYEFVFDDLASFVEESSEVKTGRHRGCYSRTVAEKAREERELLPIHAYRDELLKLIEENQVLVIVGETGSGKTTQIPQYLQEAGYTKRGKIGCTQPRRVAAMSVASRVAQEEGVKLGHEVGYSIRFEDCTSDKTVVKYMTDGMLLRELLTEPKLDSYSVIIIDEAHERTLCTDILFALVKDVAKVRPDLRLIISSATLEAKKFSDYFDSARIYLIPGRRYPVEKFFRRLPEVDYLETVIRTVFQIHQTEPTGDILVFLTGQEEIETAETKLKLRMIDLGTKGSEIIISPIYSNLPTELQAKVFEPAPKGSRKVVLATNIAETSLTIDGIRYVIDPGYCKINSYNPRTGMESLLVTPISKASAEQRAGRSGRTGPGKCYRLYNVKDLEPTTIPEIQRANLASVVLTLKSLGIQDMFNFDFMDAPPENALLKALELLYALGALDGNGEMTKVGERMVEFPVDPMLSKMIVGSEKYKCSAEIITIAAMLSVGNSIFYRPKNQQVLADNARMNFYVDTEKVGDHIALLRVYNSWKDVNYSTQWCYENYIQSKSMKRARDIRDQLRGLLNKIGIELTSNPNDLDAIKKAILAGFFPHSAKLQKDGSYRRVKEPQTVYVHPNSGLFGAPSKWLVYHELVLTTKEYMRHTTEMKPEWLIEIAPHYYKLKDIEESQPKKTQRRREKARTLKVDTNKKKAKR
ncbi:putative pre-mRNA-splicing factor ATP-dependent RNA helicase DEAH8 [Cardamine amara subsp. amara]|uniref:RNA helicase n=1 Tax=Cardamine amara subsp. amara TaxID=228776 RepID=A0ABD0ZJ14_CARAN